MSLLKLQVIGNLGKDCIQNTVNGKSVINFSVAHTEKYKDAQGVQQNKTTWVECNYWTDRTGIAPYLKSGTMVFAEGTPDLRTYVDKNGRTVPVLSLRVISVQLLGGGNRENQSQGQPQQASNAQNGNYQNQNANENVDDLPF